MMLRQPRHCRHTLVAFAFTAVAEMIIPCTFTRRDTWSDCRSGTTTDVHVSKGDQECVTAVKNTSTFRLRIEAWCASLFNMTWMSCIVSSPMGRGRVTSSATSLAASSSYKSSKYVCYYIQTPFQPPKVWFWLYPKTKSKHVKLTSGRFSVGIL